MYDANTRPSSASACPLRANLCKNPVCGSVPEIAKRSNQDMIALKRGERLTVRDGACQRIWVVISGVAATCAGMEDGRRQIIGLETPGHVVCGLASVTNSENWLEALSDCNICELSLEGVTGPLDDYPELVSSLFWLIHGRLQAGASQMVMLGRLDSVERVTLFLLEMAMRIGTAAVGGVRVDLPMTREDVADYLGLNTETVSRLFTKLKKRGLVSFPNRSTFVVPEIEALERRLPVQYAQPQYTLPPQVVAAAQEHYNVR
ncbi:Crp/Fnr family transcriptional regulator [uncultured Shimia sp.]|uniref:Crp/Fnr family transcriptional regulator n=1 Tax=uncultured Shimia sp. TaxID=573152 RepID=UPI002629F12A|nr:Crp/Fnr family transcriptional regulator [uncultured Shimia sp.]